MLAGNITRMTQGSLTVSTDRGRTRTLALTRGTTITVNDQKASAADLKPGAAVMAFYVGPGAHPRAILVGADEAYPLSRTARPGAPIDGPADD